MIAEPGRAFTAEEAPSGRRGRRAGGSVKTKGAAKSTPSPAVKKATPQQEKVLAAITQLWASRTKGQAAQAVASIRLTIKEVQEACKGEGPSNNHARDVLRAIKHCQALGLVELSEDGKIQLIRKD